MTQRPNVEVQLAAGEIEQALQKVGLALMRTPRTPVRALGMTPAYALADTMHDDHQPDKSGRIGLDHPRVTRDEALEHMVHHLQLAAMYFEATPEDDDATEAEMTRLMRQGELSDDTNPALVGAHAFLVAVRGYYARLKREQGQ